MIGSEYRAIRRFNSIRQIDIAEKSGFRSAQKICEVEQMQKVPFLFVHQLSELLNLDLTVEENVKKELVGIPERYFEKINYNRKPKYNNMPAVFVLKPRK
jgi:hypothetical protein